MGRQTQTDDATDAQEQRDTVGTLVGATVYETPASVYNPVTQEFEDLSELSEEDTSVGSWLSEAPARPRTLLTWTAIRSLTSTATSGSVESRTATTSSLNGTLR